MHVPSRCDQPFITIRIFYEIEKVGERREEYRAKLK